SDNCPEELVAPLITSIGGAPSIADKGATKKLAHAADQALAALANTDDVEAFMKGFREAGQGRSRAYEPPLASRFGTYSRGLAVMGSVRRDVIFGESRPCAVTEAGAADAKAIEKAIRRGCHVAEFTAHLQSGLRGLAEYLREKVRVYANLLES